MKRLAWLTDIHLNFVSPDNVAVLVHQVQQGYPDAVFVGGDIGEADSFAGFLRRLVALLELPIYFVLGNHDFYHGSITEVREAARSLHRDSAQLNWLPDADVIHLTDETTLVGHGGWGDGRIGNFLQSDVLLNDYALIQELRQLHRPDAVSPESILTPKLLEMLHSLGDEAAEHLREVIPKALEESGHVVVLTHVPPFQEACWHQRQISDKNWAPHFTCQAVGDVLEEFMKLYPNRRMTVLCGHTHSSGQAQILANLEVLTGEAEYGLPKVQQILEVK